MNRKRLWWVFPLVIAVSLLLMAQECEITISIEEFNTAPVGDVVNAKTGEGIADAVVTLTATDGTGAFETTSDTSGRFSFPTETENPIPPGDYTLTAEKTDVVFAPRTVSINGANQDLGEVIGFPYTDEQATDLVFALVWDADFNDVDGYITYPWPADGDTLDSTGIPTFTDPYTIPSTGDMGFTPSDGDSISESNGSLVLDATDTAVRRRVYFNYPSSNSTGSKGKGEFDLDGTDYYVELDVDDVDGSGPETITVKVAPHFSMEGGDSTFGGGNTGLPERTNTGTGSGYLWTGIMEYYAIAYEDDGDLTAKLATVDGDTAGATLYVFQGQDVLAVYQVPEYTDLKGASLVRINTFIIEDPENPGSVLDYFQLVPDLRLVSVTDQIRGLAGPDGVVVAKGASRPRY